MSTSDFSVMQVVDPRINVRAPKILPAQTGPSSSTWQIIQTSDPRSLNPVFQLRTPSVQTGIGRTVRWHMAGSLVITGTNLDQLLVQNRIAFRQYPLQSCATSMNLLVNDASISLGSLNQYLAPLLRVGVNSSSMAGRMTMNASPDVWAEYKDAVGAAGIFEPAADFVYSDKASGSRTQGITGAVLSNGNSTLTLTFDTVEDLVVPPFSFTDGAQSKALFGVSQITVSVSLANVHRMLSMAIPSGTTIGAVALSPSAQDLQFEYVTPHERSLVETPLAYSYNYCVVQPYYTDLSPIAAGATGNISSNTIELPVVPDKIIILATYSNNDISNPAISLADIFLPLSNLSCTFGTKGGLLSSASVPQLYDISRRGGVSLPYWAWAGLKQWSCVANGADVYAAGGPLAINVAADLSLPDGVTPGMNQRIQFAVTSGLARNTTSQPITPRLIVLTITSGVLEMRDGNTVLNLGQVPNRDADSFQKASEYVSEEFHENSLASGFGGATMGGSFMDFVRGMAKPALAMASLVPGLAAPAKVAQAVLGSGGAKMASKLYARA